jgi:Tol biopolymer transport system component/tRNA A-37 threonylcarbamoyl transferase component Bud32
VNVADTLRQALADRYALERELGQGGMATVYLAEDLKHHRKVALKVLRPEIAATVGAGRFAREIEVAARLQHPNILPLLDSGEVEGFFFYVMPYVEGESLRDRLARGGELPIPDAVRILMEVADALAHAHAHGVVHRDIKPDNVLLSGRHALVADFGVAKAVTEATGHQMLTSTGVALGTPTYMAPEQATAEPHQDHRVDIYALGVLGYELLTGRAPFSATTAQEMLAAHVTAAPEPVEKYRSTVSPPLAALVMKCLAKKPADRWQTADEVLQHLEPLATPSGGITPAQTQPATAIGRLPRWAKWAAGVAALAVVALVISQFLMPKPLNITLSDITPVTTEPGVEFQPAISPDGREVAYVAGPIGAPHLVIRSAANVAGGGESRPADSSLLREWYPSWSPDGDFVRFLGCRAAGCTWSETGSMGGAVRSVPLPQRALARVVAWSPDGARVAFIVADTIFASSAANTTPRCVAVHRTQFSRTPFMALHSLAWSPDGRLIAYVNGNALWRSSGNVAPSSIWVVSAQGGEPRQVAGDGFLNVSPTWLDARHLLYASNRDGPQRGVYVVEVGPQGSRGEPRIVPGVADPHSISYSIAAGKIAYARFTLRQNIRSYPLGRPGLISIRDGTPVTSGSQVIEFSDVSPDGRWLVFDSNLRGNMDLYKVPVEGGDAVPLTALPGGEVDPRWSPDGRQIAFTATAPGASGRSQIIVMPAEGGSPTALTNSPSTNSYPAWSPSGLEIAFRSNRAGPMRVWLLSRDGVGAAWHESGPFADCLSVLSDWAPDGSGVLCDTDEDLILVSPQGREIWRRNLIPTSGLISYLFARYARDGRTIYVSGTHRDGRQGVWAIPVAGGAPRLVVASDDPALVATFLSVSSDRLYLAVSQYESDIWVAKLKY